MFHIYPYIYPHGTTHNFRRQLWTQNHPAPPPAPPIMGQDLLLDCHDIRRNNCYQHPLLHQLHPRKLQRFPRPQPSPENSILHRIFLCFRARPGYLHCPIFIMDGEKMGYPIQLDCKRIVYTANCSCPPLPKQFRNQQHITNIIATPHLDRPGPHSKRLGNHSNTSHPKINPAQLLLPYL